MSETTTEFAGVPADEIACAKRAQTHAVRAKKPRKLTTEQANKLFASLSPAKKRVAIAKDVLEWLRTKKLVARFGTYLSVFTAPVAPLPGDRIKEKATYKHDSEVDVVNGGSCHACALGSVFAAAAERSCFKLSDQPGRAINRKAHDMLSPFFDVGQLNLIECAFERSTSFHYPSAAITDDDREKAKAFGDAVTAAIPEPRDNVSDFWESETLTRDADQSTFIAAARQESEQASETANRVMRAIMQNIIDNGGEFVP